MIGPTTPIANRQKRITLWTAGAVVPDGDGGYTQGEVALTPPAMWGHIRPASTKDLETIAGGTTLPTATHVVALPFHAGVTTATVLHVENYPAADRILKVVFVGNPDERNADTQLLCAEQIL